MNNQKSMKLDHFLRLNTLESHDPALRVKYWKLNENIERMCALFYKVFIKIITPLQIFPAVLISMVNYFINKLGDDSFYLACPVMYVLLHLKCINLIKKTLIDRKSGFIFRLPLNWKTPLGYLVTEFLQFHSLLSSMLFSFNLLCTFLGSCWLFQAFADDILNDIIDLNDIKITTQLNSQTQINVHFNKIIRLHADLKQ